MEGMMTISADASRLYCGTYTGNDVDASRSTQKQNQRGKLGSLLCIDTTTGEIIYQYKYLPIYLTIYVSMHLYVSM
jgi:hypothetical protein